MQQKHIEKEYCYTSSYIHCGTIQDVVSLISTLEWIGDESGKIISFQKDAYLVEYIYAETINWSCLG